MSTSIHDRVHLAGGLRLERGVPGDGAARVAALPMVAGTFVSRAGRATIELHAAWGKGIRWPQMTSHEDARDWLAPTSSVNLAPETQSGIEAGIDIATDGGIGLRITRFDQTASGLIQRLAVGGAATGESEGFEYQNVGSVANTGWELEAGISRGRLSVTGTLSLVDSHVVQLADGYAGDLMAGDRVLGVPSRTGNLSVVWTDRRWSVSATALRANDWVSYDRIALSALAADPDAAQPAGPSLRSFWTTYPGHTHVGVSLSRELRPGFHLMLASDNLLNHQVGEPDNGTVVPGRMIGIGLRVAF